TPGGVSQFLGECGVHAGFVVLGGQLVQGRDQRFGDVAAAEVAVVGAFGFTQRRGGAVFGAGHRLRTARSAGWAPAATMSATAVRGVPWVTRASPTSTASAPARA